MHISPLKTGAGFPDDSDLCRRRKLDGDVAEDRVHAVACKLPGRLIWAPDKQPVHRWVFTKGGRRQTVRDSVPPLTGTRHSVSQPRQPSSSSGWIRRSLPPPSRRWPANQRNEHTGKYRPSVCPMAVSPQRPNRYSSRDFVSADCARRRESRADPSAGYCLRRRRRAMTPTMPVPNSSRLAGSGTAPTSATI